MSFFKSVFAAAVVAAALSVSMPSIASAQVASCAYPYNTTSCGTGTLQVYVQILNPIGTPYSPGSFNVSVAGQNPSPSSFVGSQNGTIVSLGAGSYSVSLTGDTYGYTSQYSQGCNGTIANGQTALCVVTVNSGGSSFPYPVPYPYPYQNTQLVCSPAYQNAAAGAPVTFSAAGGMGAYSWTTPNRTFNNVGPNLTTTLQTTGTQTVIVTSAGQTAVCTVNVLASGGPISYPGPTYPTVVPTYVPALPNTGFAPQNGAAFAVAFALLLSAGIFFFPYVRKAALIVTR